MIPLIFGVLIGIVWAIYTPVSPKEDVTAYTLHLQQKLIMAEIFLLTGLMGLVASSLNQAAFRTAPRGKTTLPWLPWVSTLAFGSLVVLLHYAAWVPVELGALLALPCVLLPPLTYRVIRFPSLSPSPSPPIFEDKNRIQSIMNSSTAIRRFRERYPHAKAYIYQSQSPDTTGGILLHNREPLAVPTPTHIEVTLDCPFTARMGHLAEGHEVFRAYLARRHPNGSIISFLPQENWEDWLAGLEKGEWFQRIKELDGIKPTHPHLENRPLQFIESKMDWQSIPLP